MRKIKIILFLMMKREQNADTLIFSMLHRHFCSGDECMHKLNARFVLIQPTSVCPLCQRYPTTRNYKGFRHEEPTPEEMTSRALFITQHCCPLCSVQWENIFYYKTGFSPRESHAVLTAVDESV
jgi:hypothetical protein